MGLLDEWRHCPRCGVHVEPREGRAECASCGYVAYANPAPAACAICVDDQGRIFLTRRAWEPYAGMWDLPGGFLQEDEHPLDALRRELVEETGLQVEPTDWFGAFMVPYGDEPGARWVLNLVWEASVTGGEEHAADDVAELCWFAPDELPPLEEIAMAETLAAWVSRPPHGKSIGP